MMPTLTNRSAYQKFQCSSASRKFLNTNTAVAATCAASVSVLFSEPKIPQLGRVLVGAGAGTLVFQCSSASRKFLNSSRPSSARKRRTFQCSSASRKFLNSDECHNEIRVAFVSVLFSEPKIPQLQSTWYDEKLGAGFSALQRAENSSIERVRNVETKRNHGFSALQRAENSSIRMVVRYVSDRIEFQCSSASRKFLNRSPSSPLADKLFLVSVLFSEPKIPQSTGIRKRHADRSVSVLFSEPKIPQFELSRPSGEAYVGFQCSSASRKFLN